MLEVVQQQQHLLLAQLGFEVLKQRPAPALADAEGLGERCYHQGGVAEWCEIHEEHPIRKGVEQLSCDLQRQPRLATAARTSQCKQAHHRAREEVSNRSYFSGPSDKGGGRRGEPGATCGGKGCRGIADYCRRWSWRDGCASIDGAR